MPLSIARDLLSELFGQELLVELLASNYPKKENGRIGSTSRSEAVFLIGLMKRLVIFIH